MWYNDSQRIPFLLSAAVFAELHKLLCNLTIIFYVESSVLSLTVIVSGVKILSKKEKAHAVEACGAGGSGQKSYQRDRIRKCRRVIRCALHTVRGS